MSNTNLRVKEGADEYLRVPRCSDAGFVDGERALAAGGVPLGDLYVLDPAAAAPAFIAVQQASRMMKCKSAAD